MCRNETTKPDQNEKKYVLKMFQCSLGQLLHLQNKI